MSPAAIQFISSYVNAFYFGASIGPDVAIPLATSDQSILINVYSEVLGSLSMGAALASIVSSSPILLPSTVTVSALDFGRIQYNIADSYRCHA